MPEMQLLLKQVPLEMRLRELIPPDQLLPEQIIPQRSRKDLKMLLLIQSPG